MPSIVAISAVTVDLNIPTEDLTLRRLGLEPGSNVQVEEDRLGQVLDNFSRADHSQVSSGGSVSNSADLLARADFSCGLAGVGGRDNFGRLFEADCKRSGLEFLYPLQEGLSTGCNLCFHSEGGKSTIVWTTGANKYISPKTIDKEAIASASLVVIDGFIFGFGEQGPDTVSYIAQIASENKVPFVLTLASVEVVKQYLSHYERLLGRAYLLAGNQEQAATLLETSTEVDFDILRPALSNLAPNLLITRGKDGAWAKFNDVEYLETATASEVIDTTGSGDAFLAGCLIGLKKKWKVPKALKLGTTLAAKVVNTKGARLPRGKSVKELIA